ncbi:MAG: transcription factor DP1 [Benjaminiella poitrasii]|nr:MAG: transcription factor DP1 [Benjaminiella poitrasii]
MSKQPRSHSPYQRPTPTSKGLRLFSKQVSDKVAQKGITTYNEVADELAAEIQHVVDQKNVRRRVYDALNVLMAMDIIAKDRKQIKWLGIPDTTTPASSSNNSSVELEIKSEEARQTALLASVQKSSKVLDETLSHLARLRELVGRNQSGISNSVVCPLPFFIVSSHQPIRAFDVSPDGKQALLDLNSSSCRIYQDTDILAKLWPTTTTTTS